MSKQFYFKQFSLACKIISTSNNSVLHKYSLNVKTVLFQAIQFSITTQFSSICSIDKAKSGAIIWGQSGPESDGNESYSASPKLKHYLNLTIRLFIVLSKTRVERVLPFCGETAGVFYTPSWLEKERLVRYYIVGSNSVYLERSGILSTFIQMFWMIHTGL